MERNVNCSVIRLSSKVNEHVLLLLQQFAKCYCRQRKNCNWQPSSERPKDYLTLDLSSSRIQMAALGHTSTTFFVIRQLLGFFPGQVHLSEVPFNDIYPVLPRSSWPSLVTSQFPMCCLTSCSSVVHVLYTRVKVHPVKAVRWVYDVNDWQIRYNKLLHNAVDLIISIRLLTFASSIRQKMPYVLIILLFKC